VNATRRSGAVSSQPDVILVDGRAERSVSVLDRGLHFGDGVFETIACRFGRPRFLSLHMERLALGCARLGIIAGTLEDVRDEVSQLARESADHAILKILLTRGTALVRGYGATGQEKATRVTLRYAWPHEDPAWSQEGVRVRTAALRLGENPALAGIKHCNRLEQILARAESTDPDIPEALMFSHSGKLISGTMSNVFLVEEAQLRTPRLDVGGVSGVMRRVVLREAGRAGVDARECDLHADDLHRASEVFLTNARIGIWPVRSVDERALGAPGPITRHLQRLVAPLLEEPAHE
jgi:4-amino-4-deoxychorismate lyase